MVRLKVRELAEQKGYNQSSLARATKLGYSTIKRLWQNPYHETSTVTLEKIARVLGVKTSDLLEDEPD